MKLTRTFSRVLCSVSGEDVVISHLDRSDIPEAVKFTHMAFGKMSGLSKTSDMERYLEYGAQVDWNMSLKATVGGKIVGIYLLKDKNLEEGMFEFREDISGYADKKGLEGISLVVLPEYRGLGVGNKLKRAALSLGHDYMWGMQLHKLKNLEHWKKTRRHIGDAPGVYVTLQDIEKKNSNGNHIEI